uniref:G_PROTEIN_RECEP_F1_2 domain-containing protein n=1 Tax=Angiostrongylus cantonensis TaxID=6313 RepID=A0A0K0DLZ9_ANGCA
LLVFFGLESLGVLAIIGNISLIYVLIRIKYLNKASFILIFNLAVADVMHAIVTTCYFYPPIILKRIHVGELFVRLFNIIDWTAWAITLT